MMAPSLRRRWAFALLLVIPALFASNNIAARLADGVVAPASLAFWRWFVAGVLLVPLVAGALSRKWPQLRGELVHLLLLGFIGMTLVSIATYAGAQTTTASNVGLIYASTPVMILLLDWGFSGIRLSSAQIAGLALCVGGIGFIVLRGDPLALVELRFSRGDVLICAGALAWAVYSVLLKYWPSKLSVLERAAATAMAGVLTSFPLATLERGGAGAGFTWQAVGIVLCVGVLAGALLITAHAFVTAELGPRVAVVLLYLIPLYNIALAWLLLSEELQLYQAVGGAFVLLGVVFATLPSRSPRKKAQGGTAR